VEKKANVPFGQAPAALMAPARRPLSGRHPVLFTRVVFLSPPFLSHRNRRSRRSSFFVLRGSSSSGTCRPFGPSTGRSTRDGEGRAAPLVQYLLAREASTAAQATRHPRGHVRKGGESRQPGTHAHTVLASVPFAIASLNSVHPATHGSSVSAQRWRQEAMFFSG